MNIQGKVAEHHSFKIIFSNIQCKINITDSAHFAFVIRIGKRSSKYTQKKQILQGTLEFNDVLEVPIDQKLLNQQSAKKQKCEIMLYKFRINREKQCKELIGMASVAIQSQMFDVQTKKVRLTNSSDKEAFVQCTLKIEMGEADFVSHSESKLSSFILRSDQHSINNDITKSRNKQNNQTSANKNHVRIGLITSNSRQSLRQASGQKGKQNDSFLQLLNGNQNIYGPEVHNLQVTSQQVITRCQQPTKMNYLIGSDKGVQEQNTKLKEICKQLYEKNQTMKNTIENLQNQMLNQSIISNRSASSQNPKIPRPGGNIKRSPMIKKNATITITPSFSRLQANGTAPTQDLLMQANDQQNGTNGPKKGGIVRSQIKLNTSQDLQNQSLPYFMQKGSRVIQQASKITQQNIDVPLHLTFAGQRFTQRNRLSLIPVIQVKYSPPTISAGLQYGSNDRDKSIIQSSVSEAQRRNNRSYTKFNGKRKYQMIGAIRSPDNSQINMSVFDQEVDQNHKREGGSILLGKSPLGFTQNQDKSFNLSRKKQSPFNVLRTEGAQNQKPFLDFLKEKDQTPFLNNIKDITEVVTPKLNLSNLAIPQGLFHQRKTHNEQSQGNLEGWGRSRLTLQELDIKTQERFRKNQRSLKLANMKILQENRTLKNQRKILEEKIQLKKQLSHDEFKQLRSQITHLRQKIQQSTKQKQQRESKYEQLANKFSKLQEENLKLKKDLREQKAKYDYYFKMSNINDDKQKERQNVGPWESAFVTKKSTATLHSEVSSPGDNSKKIGKNDRSMTSISNFNKEDRLKEINHADKSLKKVDFSIQKHDEDIIDASSLKKVEAKKPENSKATSSTAISKLKMHLKPTIPKCPINGIHGLISQMNSPANQSFTGSNASAPFGTLKGGLIGTGQTIVNKGQTANNFLLQK